VALDADFDRLQYTFVWKNNGRIYTAKGESNRIPASETRRGQRWTCEVVPHDGEVAGKGARAEATIENSAPSSPMVKITPSEPIAGQPLRCEIIQPSEDPDGDKISYSFTWTRNGLKQSFAPTSVEIPGRLVRARDIWHCEAHASDRATQGDTARSSDVIVAKKE
jgi:hypothetical protein